MLGTDTMKTKKRPWVFLLYSIGRWIVSTTTSHRFVMDEDWKAIAVQPGASYARESSGGIIIRKEERGHTPTPLSPDTGQLPMHAAPWWSVLPSNPGGKKYCAVVLVAVLVRQHLIKLGAVDGANSMEVAACMPRRMHDRSRFTVYEAGVDSDEVHFYPGKKTGFLSHLYIKVIFLPRLARDKHRENSKKSPFCRRWIVSGCSEAAPLHSRWQCGGDQVYFGRAPRATAAQWSAVPTRGRRELGPRGREVESWRILGVHSWHVRRCKQSQ